MANFDKLIEESYKAEKSELTFIKLLEMVEKTMQEVAVLEEQFRVPQVMQTSAIGELPKMSREAPAATKEYLGNLPGAGVFEKFNNLQKLLSNPETFGDFQENLNKREEKHEKDIRRKASKSFSAVMTLNYLMYIFSNFEPSTLGFINETLLGAMLGGKEIPTGQNTIGDFYSKRGDQLISLKTLKENGAIKGSVHDLVMYDLLADPERTGQRREAMMAMVPYSAGSLRPHYKTNGKMKYQIISKQPGELNEINFKLYEFEIDATSAEGWQTFINSLSEGQRKYFMIPTEEYLANRDENKEKGENIYDRFMLSLHPMAKTKPAQELRREFLGWLSKNELPKTGNRIYDTGKDNFWADLQRLKSGTYSTPINMGGQETPFALGPLLNPSDETGLPVSLISRFDNVPNIFGTGKTISVPVTSPDDPKFERQTKQAQANIIRKGHEVIKAKRVGKSKGVKPPLIGDVIGSVAGDYYSTVENFFNNFVTTEGARQPQEKWSVKAMKNPPGIWNVGYDFIQDSIYEKYRNTLPSGYMTSYEAITLGQIYGNYDSYTAGQKKYILRWIKEVLDFKFPDEDVNFNPDNEKEFKAWAGTSGFFEVQSKKLVLVREEAAKITIADAIRGPFQFGNPTVPWLNIGGSLVYTPGVVLQALMHVVGFFHAEVVKNSPALDMTTNSRIKGMGKSGQLWKHIESKEEFKYLPLCFGVVHRANFAFTATDLEQLKERGGRVQEYKFNFGPDSKNWQGVVEKATEGVIGRLAWVHHHVGELLSSVDNLVVKLKGGNYQEDAGLNLLERYADLTNALATTHQDEYEREREVFLPTKRKKDAKDIKKVKRYKTGLKE